MSQQFWIDNINALDAARPVQKQLGEILRLQLGNESGAKEKASAAEKSSKWAFLNDAGRRAARRDELADLVKSNAQARIAVKKLRSDIKMPKLPGREKDDLTGFLADQEARAFVRTLPPDKLDSLQRLHPDIVAAIARAPAELSGVPQSVHTELVNATLRQTHGPELAKMAADLAALELADELIRETDKEIRAAAEIQHGTDFRTWAKPLLDPILAEAGEEFDELYRRREPEGLNVLGALAAA